ncbi:hypothetical protein D9613_008906 [Agrocybe pediades]|uniref:NadR/Ttd14 AAA domain-containing protein n=1 Tax=Agrocybe pediades TaxID=84607 RepID=A0A8H4QSP5_9AGAR|nr:hypothetical protein D9613_008906 [Agrocybe pediades]
MSPPTTIYVIGPSSTGKTTLCTALAQKIGLPEGAFVSEVARTVMREKGYSRHTIDQVQMQQDIMEAYFAKENELDARNHPIRLFDRSAIDPIVYAILTSKNDEEARERKKFLVETPTFTKALAKYRSNNCIIIMLKTVEEWLVDDGVRSLEKQEDCLKIFRALLKELNISYHELGEESKFLQERVILTLGWARF